MRSDEYPPLDLSEPSWNMGKQSDHTCPNPHGTWASSLITPVRTHMEHEQTVWSHLSEPSWNMGKQSDRTCPNPHGTWANSLIAPVRSHMEHGQTAWSHLSEPTWNMGKQSDRSPDSCSSDSSAQTVVDKTAISSGEVIRDAFIFDLSLVLSCSLFINYGIYGCRKLWNDAIILMGVLQPQILQNKYLTQY